MDPYCAANATSEIPSKAPEDPPSKDSEAAAIRLEKSHVHEVYEGIAEHFSDTRRKPWPRVAEFVLSLPSGTRLLDSGCGNGKYLNLSGGDYVFKVGCDRSEQLLSICRRNGHQVARCDAVELPFGSDSFDACISIAVIHHMASSERRLRALRELVRVLVPGGRALVYVWALEQTGTNYLKKGRAKEAGKEDRRIGSLPVHVNRTQFEGQDVLVPWRNKTRDVFHRFYHVFRKGELEALCAECPGVAVLDSFYDNGNWCVLFARQR